MNNYYQAKVRYNKTMEDGKVKAVTEPYLIDAANFEDVEKRVLEEFRHLVDEEFRITEIKETSYDEIIQSEEKDADCYYECKLQFDTFNEESGRECKKTTTILMQATSVDDASKKVECHLGCSMAEYTKVAIKESKIVDIFNYIEDGKS